MSLVATVDNCVVKRGELSVYIYTEPQQTVKSVKENVCRFFGCKNPDDARLLYKREPMKEDAIIESFKMHNPVEKELLFPSIRFQMKAMDGEWETLPIFEGEVGPVPEDAIAAINALAARSPNGKL
jgi:hypothetical protein